MLPGIELAAAAVIQCTVPKAPVISVVPVTKDIRYDYSKTDEELTRLRSDSINPYGVNADTTTGGLRADKARTTVEVKWSYREFKDSDAVCMWYDSVKVSIELSPTIYVANTMKGEACRAAILEHEKRHVAVDRAVINKYSSLIGKAIAAAVNQAGAMGPYKTHALPVMREKMQTHIQSAISSLELPLHQEMRAQQAAVDSLAEYERVGKICGPIEKKRR